MGSLGGWEIVILLVVVVALFGAKRLPDMARSIGQSARVFKGEMKGLRDDEKTPRAAARPWWRRRSRSPAPCSGPRRRAPPRRSPARLWSGSRFACAVGGQQPRRHDDARRAPLRAAQPAGHRARRDRDHHRLRLHLVRGADVRGALAR